jgi:hypothetical protein
MSDLVVTVPKTFWNEWLAEGDCAGDPPQFPQDEWGYHVGTRPNIETGERLYVVAWGLLRGYAHVTRVVQAKGGWAICREGGAQAVTIEQAIPGFRGYRRRWWERDAEFLFQRWKTEGVPQ